MHLNAIFDPARGWWRSPGADARALEMLRRNAPVELPEDLYAFLAASDGGEGELGIAPGWFALWRVEDLLLRNADYDVPNEYPGYFGFGSNGGGELLAFQLTESRCGRVAMIAFIGGEPIVIADSFADFAAHIGIPCVPAE